MQMSSNNEEEQYTKLSVFISLILRHKPETINIKLDMNGYASVDELIAGINRSGRYIDISILESIVASDNKGRYSFSDDKKKIRANQGHSIDVDVELREVEPPSILYHGTAVRFLDSILKSGLDKMKRNYVHLTDNIDTANKVGKRHGEVVIIEIRSGEMFKDGYKFYISENNVYLIESVPSKYITVLEV